jgi:hypothetical protein
LLKAELLLLLLLRGAGLTRPPFSVLAIRAEGRGLTLPARLGTGLSPGLKCEVEAFRIAAEEGVAFRLRGRAVVSVSTPAGIKAVEDMDGTLLFDDAVVNLDIVEWVRDLICRPEDQKGGAGWNA